MSSENLLQNLSPEHLKKINRKKTREVKLGNLVIGGESPVVVQEMTSTYTADIDKTVRQIRELEEFGCKLIRVAVPDAASARALKHIREHVRIPVVADIHFDYRLALLVIESGADKLRINPGNIGGARKVAILVAAAKERGIPIRVGVNSGSLEKAFMKKYGGITAQGMVDSALGQVSFLEKHGFYDIVISLKSPDIQLTVEANKIISSQVDYPLHIGITESGFGEQGKVRSAVGLSTLLVQGIGDTVRVSLTEQDRRENLRLCYHVLDGLSIPYM
jgi:(E)-4-hydroxy-3-methylbut-2-enyl-diphosphate synthase